MNTRLEKSKCSCPWYCKKKHYELRSEALQIPIGQNRKRRRPHKATRALIRVPQNYKDEEDSDEEVPVTRSN